MDFSSSSGTTGNIIWTNPCVTVSDSGVTVRNADIEEERRQGQILAQMREDLQRGRIKKRPGLIHIDEPQPPKEMNMCQVTIASPILCDECETVVMPKPDAYGSLIYPCACGAEYRVTNPKQISVEKAKAKGEKVDGLAGKDE